MGNSQQANRKSSQTGIKAFLSLSTHVEDNKMRAKVKISSKRQLEIWKANIIKLRQLKQNYILEPITYEVEQKNFICGSTQYIEVEYECYCFSVKEEMKKRIPQKNYFQQVELWYILYKLVGAADFCHNIFTQKVGNIKPQNILANVNGKLQILSQFSVPHQIDSFSQYVLEYQKNYLSPQQMVSCQNKHLQNTNNYVLCQSFSIGMTLLSIGLLEDMLDMYNLENHTIDAIKFKSMLDSWTFSKKGIKYSDSLKNIVASMVEFNRNTRLTSLEVFQLLKPYEKSIIHLQPFILKGLSIQQNQLQQDYLKTERFEQNPREKQRHVNGYIHLNSRKRSSLKNTPKKQQRFEKSQVLQIPKRQFESQEVVSQYVPAFKNYGQSINTNTNKPTLTFDPSHFEDLSLKPNLLDEIDRKLMKSRKQFPS